MDSHGIGTSRGGEGERGGEGKGQMSTRE